MSEFIQGTHNVIHEGEISHDPGIVESRRESKFVTIERMGWILGDEEPIPVGPDRALGDRVSGGGTGHTDDTLGSDRVRAGTVPIITVVTFGGQLKGDGGWIVGGIGEGVRFRPGSLPGGPGIPLVRLDLHLLVLFVNFRNWIGDIFSGSFQDRHPPRKPGDPGPRIADHPVRSFFDPLGRFPRRLLIRQTDSRPQFAAGEGWNPRPADNQTQQP